MQTYFELDENAQQKANDDNGADLQAAFLRFRKAKVRERRNRKHLAAQRRVEPSILRQKFVAAAESYFGVPYARRYHEPGSEHYDSPLFLDCCALVRRCVADLHDEFGFRLPRWNQAYQFDTLPDRVSSVDELEPGDLVFCSGVYNNPKARAQRFNMVHVEVFVGGAETPEATIGARWQKGVVQRFDSYRFKSKSYHSQQYFFCKVDPWLRGICKPAHPSLWSDGCSFNGKTSIFERDYVEEAAEPQEEGGEGASDPEAKLFYVGKGNNPTIVVDALLERGGWVRSSFSFSGAVALKWTESRSEIDYSSHRPEEQLVNHISNNSVLTTKHGLLSTLRDFHGAAAAVQPGERLYAFYPESYRLDIPSEALNFLFGNAPEHEDALWVVKPTSSNRGRGIRIVQSLESLRQDATNVQGCRDSGAPTQAHSSSTMRSLDLVVQRYIERPLLLHGRKFDVRSFLLVANAAPGKLLGLYHDGYCRLSMEPFARDTKKHPTVEHWIQDRFVHLTNASVQKLHPDYVKAVHSASSTAGMCAADADAGNIWSMAQLGDYVESGDDWLHKVRNQMVDAMRTCLKAASDKLDRTPSCFDLLGFDFMISDDASVHLLEINTNPALIEDCPLLSSLLRPLVRQTLDIVFEATERERRGDRVCASTLPHLQNVGERGWTVVLDEESAVMA